MSKHSSSFVSSSYSYSSSSSNVDGQTSGHRSVQQSYTDPSGTTVKQSTQNLGEPVVEETRRYDAQGRELIEGAAGSTQRRIQDVDEEQAERDREYEERIEDEYAKRDGGA